MSVIPQENNLVMSFAEATRVFNTDQSNSGSFIPGTGDADVQAPAPVQGSTDPQMRDHYPEYLGERPAGYNTEKVSPHQSQIAGRRRSTRGDTATTPFDVPDGPASVVPPVLPSAEHVAAHPEFMVSIRNPNQEQQIDAEDEYYTNYLFSTRSYMRVYFAEFLGTLILVVWGEGTQAQVVAARKEPGDYLSVAWGWGVGFMGFVLNPARDLGPRLFLWLTGSSRHELWRDDNSYGIWIPTIGTVTGAIFGILLYDLLIYNGRDSPVNFNYSRRQRVRARHLRDVEQTGQFSGSTNNSAHPQMTKVELQQSSTPKSFV
ncbi:hypothetical protein P7C70_g2568, partial [Phenoliferia sp. Uapishka_3]